MDESTGAIARREPYVDRNITPVGSKLFPRFLSFIENGKTVAEVRVLEIKTTEPIPVSAFDPPVGTVSRPGCMNSISGRLLKRVQPQYPEPERQAHAQGTVAIYGVIGTDGVPRQLQIVSGVSPGLNKASLDAIQQWQYEVATCDGTPVEAEAVISINYSLSQF